MSSVSPASGRHPRLAGVLLALLAANTAVYLLSGTLSEGLDSVAWLTILVSFELETGRSELFRGRTSRIALRAARLLAAAALVAAGVGYVRGGEWLDAVNISLWTGVVVLLELEVRCPEFVRRRRGAFVAALAASYAGLAGLVFAWMLRGEWFDAYDAALWLLAFATLEIDLVGRFRDGGLAT